MDAAGNGFVLGTMGMADAADFSGRKVCVAGRTGVGKSTVIHKARRRHVNADFREIEAGKAERRENNEDSFLWLCVDAESVLCRSDKVAEEIKGVQESCGGRMFVVLTKRDAVGSRELSKALGLFRSLRCRFIDL